MSERATITYRVDFDADLSSDDSGSSSDEMENFEVELKVKRTLTPRGGGTPRGGTPRGEVKETKEEVKEEAKEQSKPKILPKLDLKRAVVFKDTTIGSITRSSSTRGIPGSPHPEADVYMKNMMETLLATAKQTQQTLLDTKAQMAQMQVRLNRLEVKDRESKNGFLWCSTGEAGD